MTPPLKPSDIASVDPPVSPQELARRRLDYQNLSRRTFTKQHSAAMAFRPAVLWLHGIPFRLQVNRCTNPLCAHFGLEQDLLPKESGRRVHRYTVKTYTEETPLDDDDVAEADADIEIFGARNGRKKPPRPKSPVFLCTARNDKNGNCLDPQVDTRDNTLLISNWAVAEEIARLANRTVPRYRADLANIRYHHDGCPNAELTPYDHPEAFTKKGVSAIGTQRYRCPKCGKITNMPADGDIDYHQQRNDILAVIAELMVGHTPISKAADNLKIGRQTYYNKLLLVQQKCLEFAAIQEAKLAAMPLGTVWLNTDSMEYHNANRRRRRTMAEIRKDIAEGTQPKRYEDTEPRMRQTHILVTADGLTGYVLRADVAYDPDVSQEDIEHQTKECCDDHLGSYCRRFSRLRRSFSCAPMPPTPHDDQTLAAYEAAKKNWEIHRRYPVGFHTSTTITAIAHLFHVREMIKASVLNFVTDEAPALKTAVARVFCDEIRDGRAHGFTCRSLSATVEEALDAYYGARELLEDLIIQRGLPDNTSLWDMATQVLTEEVTRAPLYRPSQAFGGLESTSAKYNHPLPKREEGCQQVSCWTDISRLSPRQQAVLLMQVSNSAANRFINRIRRAINPLERPMVSQRGPQTSYIFANSNPAWAQAAVDILRVVYNYCVKPASPLAKRKRKKRVGYGHRTPAMRLHLADRPYTLEEIIYGTDRGQPRESNYLHYHRDRAARRCLDARTRKNGNRRAARYAVKGRVRAGDPAKPSNGGDEAGRGGAAASGRPTE